MPKRNALALLVGENFRDPGIALKASCAIEQVAVVSSRHPLGLPLGAWYSTQSAILAAVHGTWSVPTKSLWDRQIERLSNRSGTLVPAERACSINTLVDPVCGALARMP
jgi:hypothetical protein